MTITILTQSMTLQSLRITGGYGNGGVINNSGELTVTNSTLTGNTANLGGALFNAAGHATFTDSDLTGITANNSGVASSSSAAP